MAAIPDADDRPAIGWITFNGARCHLRPFKSARKTLCGIPARSGSGWHFCNRDSHLLERCEDCEAEIERRYPNPGPEPVAPPPPANAPPLMLEAPAPEPRRIIRKPRRSRSSARSNAAQRHKVALAKSGLRSCERCGHSPPRQLAARILHIHHVYPVALGGTDDKSNLVLLCANCHALTHALCLRRKDRWYGPASRADYFDWMAEQTRAYAETDAWMAEMAEA